MNEARTITLLALTLIGLGVWWLIPRAGERNRWAGLASVFVGLFCFVFVYRLPDHPIVGEALFFFFAASTLFCGVLTVTNKNPVYSALYFALATLGLCGLLILQSAPFLAAATAIVYAGAIVVTFVFVIMLAQQAGSTRYDQHSRQPGLATISAFVFLSAILLALQHSAPQLIAQTPEVVVAEITDPATETNPETTTVEVIELDPKLANPLSQPRPGEQLGSMHGMGRALFGDFLFAVELAGVLLMVASIGAIAISPRRGVEAQ